MLRWLFIQFIWLYPAPFRYRFGQEGTCIPVSLGRALPELAAGQRRCRNMVNPRAAVDLEAGTLVQFAALLGMALDRPVIDKTGIAGYFQIRLVFSTDDSSVDAPGIFQAIQEQLALKLVPAKGPVDVLVIDHVERPTEN